MLILNNEFHLSCLFCFQKCPFLKSTNPIGTQLSFVICITNRFTGIIVHLHSTRSLLGAVYKGEILPEAPVMSIFLRFLHSRIPTVSLPDVGTYLNEKHMSPRYCNHDAIILKKHVLKGVKQILMALPDRRL